MNKPKVLKSWSARQAVALLAVDNIKVSDFGYSMLQRREEGTISYEQAKQEIFQEQETKSWLQAIQVRSRLNER